MMRRALWGGLLLAACQRTPSPSAEPAASAPAASSSPPVASSSPPAAASAPTAASGLPPGGSASPAASSDPAAPAPLPTLAAKCCRLDRTEGHFGPEKGLNARYSGDVLVRNDGERLLFPQDLINDTRELYQFARSAGKPLYQERRLRLVGEGPHHISVEIEERGETGATTPFFHSRCATIDLRTRRAARLDALLPPGQAEAVLAAAQRAFEQRPGHERFRFVAASFALGAERLRLCCPARDDRQDTARLDVEVPVVLAKLLLRRPRRCAS